MSIPDIDDLRGRSPLSARRTLDVLSVVLIVLGVAAFAVGAVVLLLRADPAVGAVGLGALLAAGGVALGYER